MHEGYDEYLGRTAPDMRGYFTLWNTLRFWTLDHTRPMRNRIWRWKMRLKYGGRL